MLNLRESRGSDDVDVLILSQDRTWALVLRTRSARSRRTGPRTRGQAMRLAEGMSWSKQRRRARSCSKHECRRPNNPKQQTGVKPNTCLTRPRQASQAGSTRPDRAKHGRTEQREACLSMSRASSDSTHVNRVNLHRIRADASGCTPQFLTFRRTGRNKAVGRVVNFDWGSGPEQL